MVIILSGKKKEIFPDFSCTHWPVFAYMDAYVPVWFRLKSQHQHVET